MNLPQQVSNVMILALNSMMETREKPSETGQGAISNNLDMMAGVFGSMAAFARMIAVAAFEAETNDPKSDEGRSSISPEPYEGLR